VAGKAGRSADDAARMPLGEHIRELRNRLLKAALAVLVGAVVGFIFRGQILHTLEGPVCNIHGLKGVGQYNPQCPDGALVFSGACRSRSPCTSAS
jgi:sec-independent protein translocase protein TatC